MDIAKELFEVANELKAAETFKCEDCGTKVLKNTGFCVKCKKKVKKGAVRDLMADDDRRATFLKVLKGINSVRGRFDPTSDEGVFLGIVRDMASAIRRGQGGSVTELSREMIREFG